MITDLAQATKALSGIADLSVSALDPQLTREDVIARVKAIYELSVIGEDVRTSRAFWAGLPAIYKVLTTLTRVERP